MGHRADVPKPHIIALDMDPSYFHGRRRRLMLEKILDALAPHGYVILGRKEGLHPDDEAFVQPVSGMPAFYLPSHLKHSGE